MSLRILTSRSFHNAVKSLPRPFCRNGLKPLRLWCGVHEQWQNSLGVAAPTYRRWQSGIAGQLQDVSAIAQDSHAHESPDGLSFSLTACPGCGALAQIVNAGAAGYYSTKRKTVYSFIKLATKQSSTVEDPDFVASQEHPLCDRCHGLIHHQAGVPILHPSLDSLADIISETPHKYNHIYHVIDAADFPMSLLPGLRRALSISAQRSKNRRSKSFKFMHGRLTEVTFVITRSDLLAPQKEQVDRLMPTLVEILRDVLGAAGRDVRLGNVCCVSAKRGWWITNLKADIWERGGGGWMVGKANVGKSNLFEVVFPKGRAEAIKFRNLTQRARLPVEAQERLEAAQDKERLELVKPEQKKVEEDDDTLLPRARLETPYPTMPTVSSLPGTTAAPIRIPFGKGKGELIDLPGLARSDIENFVVEAERQSLLMKSRCTPEQYVLKPGSSLLLGGLVRITPTDPDVVIMAYPFSNLSPHLTSTSKAAEIQTGERSSGVSGLVANNAGQASMASAGKFRLQWDVTKHRAGPLTSTAAAGLKPKNLPFVVLSADILIESVGWVELVAQVRKSRRLVVNDAVSSTSPEPGETQPTRSRSRVINTQVEDEPIQFPEVEVFSPEGKFIGVRRPLNAWILGGLQTKPGKAAQAGRPRRSIRNTKGTGARSSDSPSNH